MKTERSFGVVPLRCANKKFRFFLVRHRAGHWGFPKGHRNKGESPVQTARRELKEETGIRLKTILKRPRFVEHYRVKRSDGVRKKTVTLFLGIAQNASYRIDKSEIRSGGWFVYAKARSKLTFVQGRQLIQKVRRYLNGAPGFSRFS